MLGFLTGMLAVVVSGFLFLKILPIIAVLTLLCAAYSLMDKYISRALKVVGF